MWDKACMVQLQLDKGHPGAALSVGHEDGLAPHSGRSRAACCDVGMHTRLGCKPACLREPSPSGHENARSRASHARNLAPVCLSSASCADVLAAGAACPEGSGLAGANEEAPGLKLNELAFGLNEKEDAFFSSCFSISSA